VLAMVWVLGVSAAFSAEIPNQPRWTREVQQRMRAYFSKAAGRFLTLSANEKAEYFSYRTAKQRVSLVTSQDPKANDPWSQKDPAVDGLEGTRTEKAYRELGLRSDVAPVTVAVIDSGVDTEHEDLRTQIQPGGWNFLGNSRGHDVTSATLEITRELRRLDRLASTIGLTPEQKSYQTQVQALYNEELGETKHDLEKFQSSLTELEAALEVLKRYGLKETTLEAIEAFPVKDDVSQAAKATALAYLKDGVTVAKLKRAVERTEHAIKTYFDLTFEISDIIGDDPDNATESGYGNTHVTTETADHGTHCSGIIGAVRDNGIGMNGQAAAVRILPIRAVPDGDERDKDVANSVRYAVDHGARILSMSFGKTLSPFKDAVDSAFRYARERGALVIHAAGNDATDVDGKTFFPTKHLLDGSELDNWITVGASGPKAGKRLAAAFSNYGQRGVDIFAPGVEIYSTIPGNQYAAFKGTSMAAPQVAGVAALLWSQYPQLTAQQVRKVLLESVRPHHGLQVLLPGGDEGQLVDFATLSTTGGVLDAYTALTRAAGAVTQGMY